MKKGRSILLGLTAALIAAPVGAQTYYSDDTGAVTMPNGFARTMEVVDGHLLVGESATQIRAGAVYVYGNDGMGWSEMGIIRAADGMGGDGFGQALAADGDHLLVSSSMGVHYFGRDGDMWTEMGMIEASGAMEGDGFGGALDVSGDWAVIGAGSANENAGAAYLFHFDGENWNEAGMAMLDDADGPEFFGAVVAIEGSRVAISAPLRNNRQGAVFVYEAGMSGLSQVGAIAADGLNNNAQFGATLWVGTVPEIGDAIIASAPNQDQGRGTVRLFVEADGEWVEGARLSAFDPQARSGFGSALGWTGDGFVIGSPGSSQTGVLYLYNVEGTRIGSAEKIVAEGIEPGNGFGATIAVGENFLAVGATRANGGDGAVVIYDADGGETMLMTEPEGYESITGNDDDVRCQDGRASEWECTEVDLVSFLDIADLSGDGTRGINTNDNWGWTDPDTGKEYALVGMTDRLSMVDMSNPFNPVVVGILPMPEGARGSSWRDVKTYMNHAYVVSDNAGEHGMQVFDLTRLREFDGEITFYEADAIYRGIASAHNIVINEESGFAYSVGSSTGGESCGGGLHMIDIRDPKSPEFAGCFSDPQTGRASTGYSHDAQCVNYVGPDSDYEGREICIGSNETAISIADVTDKDNAVAVSRAAYPNPGYTHQGWLTPDHRFLYVNDELDELSGIVDRTRTIIWDLTDLDDPQLVAEHLGTQESSDHNLYIEGDLMYQSNYQSGLRILDITDRGNPTEVAFFDTVPYGDNGAGFGGSWSNYPYFSSGVVLVTSGSEGMFLVRPTVRRTVF